MSSSVSSRLARSRPVSRRAASSTCLPHWSETSTPPGLDEPGRDAPSPEVAVALRDLVVWAAEIAIRLTRDLPEDRAAIEEVRDYALAWLAGQPCAHVPIEHVLTTVAALLSAIDLDLARAACPGDEPAAIDTALDP